MDLKIKEIVESVNAVSRRLKDIPKEDFSKILEKELKLSQTVQRREDIKVFVQNLPRNIVFEDEKRDLLTKEKISEEK